MTAVRGRLKRLIGGVYSAAAEQLYEPLVVRGAFPLLGGDLNRLVLEQGRRAVRRADGRAILDMPVGTAHFTVEMARRHQGLVVGSDLAEGMVLQARRAGVRDGIRSLALVRADAHALPFKDASFRAVMCSNGLQVIPGLARTVTELARVLEPSGSLFVSVVTLPASRLVPRAAATRLPAILKSSRELVDALASTGLTVTIVTRERLALLIEAIKNP